jgi:flagellar motor switch protein FliM
MMMMMMLSQDEIDSLLASVAVAPEAAPKAGAVATAGPAPSSAASHTSLQDILEAEKQKNYKIYNFKRPDKFSKEHLRALEAIHESFARQVSLLLSGFLRTGVEIDVASVDQLTYDELTRSMPRPITVGVVDFRPLKGQMLFGLSHEITMAIIDRMLGGKGSLQSKARDLTDVEVNLMSHTMKRLLECLGDSWRSLVPDSRISLKALEENYSLLQIALPSEIVAVVTFELSVGNKESGLMSLCFPYPMLERIIPQLSSQHLFSQHHSEDDEDLGRDVEILRRMHYAQVEASVYLGGTSLHVQHLLSLQVGDVLKLDTRATDPLLVCINNEPKFFAQAGTQHKQLAVQVSETLENADGLKGYGVNPNSLV